MEAERYASAAAFDGATGRAFVVTPNPFQTSVQILAYEAGRSTPVWSRTFAAVSDESVNATSYASAILVAPKRHRVYVGGGYIDGTGSGPFTSAGYVFAFDTRTGAEVWSHTDLLQAGMGGHYNHLADGPGGSVIAVERELLTGEPHNSAGSYVTEVASFDEAGRERWRWTDTRTGLMKDVTTTKTGVLAVVGETYVEGWAHGYAFALDDESGRLAWRQVFSPMEWLHGLAASPAGHNLYVAGSTTRDDGSDAALRALSTQTGETRWTRRLEPPAPGVPGDLSYYGASRVVAGSTGPCVTGGWAGRRAVTYDPILPDDGFVACYSPAGRRIWVDRHTGAPGRVLVAAGRRLLWAGRGEASRDRSSQEVLRFAIRSLDDGTVRNSSQFEYRTATYDASKPLLAFAYGDAVHFVVATTHERNTDGSIKGPPGLFDRIFR